MRTAWNGLRAMSLAGLALALAAGLGAQSPGTSTTQTTPAAQPAPGTTPVSGDTPAADSGKQASTGTVTGTAQSSGASSTTPAAQPAPGTTPVSGDTPASTTPSKAPAPGTTPVGGDTAATDVNPEKVIEPGSQKINVKPGSIEDVNAVGNRDIGGRGMGNWYSVDTEIKMGKMYAEEIEKSTKFITDPVIVEYVNRVGQNIVKNSDCKVPFTIKVIDSDEINAMALPGRVLLRELRPDSECGRRGGTGRRDGA